MNMSNDRHTFFVDVIVPLPVPGVFTYRVPHELNGEVLLGKRVVVQFGKKKIYAASQNIFWVYLTMKLL
jgi:primosomal protein N' (replication factor Y) (superfamily II helicase)